MVQLSHCSFTRSREVNQSHPLRGNRAMKYILQKSMDTESIIYTHIYIFPKQSLLYEFLTFIKSRPRYEFLTFINSYPRVHENNEFRRGIIVIDVFETHSNSYRKVGRPRALQPQHFSSPMSTKRMRNSFSQNVIFLLPNNVFSFMLLNCCLTSSLRNNIVVQLLIIVYQKFRMLINCYTTKLRWNKLINSCSCCKK